MTFAIANFIPVGGQSSRGLGPQVFAYRTADSVATCNTSGYFNAGTAYKGAANLLDIGDIIDIVVVDSVTTPTSVTAVSRVIVNSVSAGVVDVTDGESVTVGDAD